MRSIPELQVGQAKIDSGFPEAGKDLRAEEVHGGTDLLSCYYTKMHWVLAGCWVWKHFLIMPEGNHLITRHFSPLLSLGVDSS